MGTALQGRVLVFFFPFPAIFVICTFTAASEQGWGSGCCWWERNVKVKSCSSSSLLPLPQILKSIAGAWKSVWVSVVPGTQGDSIWDNGLIIYLLYETPSWGVKNKRKVSSSWVLCQLLIFWGTLVMTFCHIPDLPGTHTIHPTCSCWSTKERGKKAFACGRRYGGLCISGAAECVGPNL